MDGALDRIFAGIEAASASTEHEAALRLLSLIAEAEHWRDRAGGLPAREEILACYADCVAAARGEAQSSPAPPENAAFLPNLAVDEVPDAPAASTAIYESVQELSPPAPAAAPPEELILIDESVSVEA